MTRLLICSLLALGLVACGSKDAPQPVADTRPAASEAPASTAEATTPVAVAEPSAAAAPSDGESVDEDVSSASPIAAAVAATTPATSTPLPAKWKQGTHFTALPAAQPVTVAPGEVEITEIFWYGCGHCFALEPHLASWEKGSKPAYVKLIRMPVVWNEVTREDARLFYTLEALGKLEALNVAVFRELHVNRKPLTIIAGNRVDTAATERRVREFLAAGGVNAEDFGRTYRSFAIENKIRQAEALSRRYQADHTPMVVVQGKYMTDVSMAGGLEPFFELMGDLAARERGTR